MRKILVAMMAALVIGMTLATVANTSNFVAKAQTPIHGVVSIVFDDNYQDQIAYALPIMNDKGIKGTFYVVSDHISDFSGDASYMSIAELQTLQASGNEIGSHSNTHSDFTSMSQSQIRAECSISKQILESNGLSVTNFAYPDGKTNNTVDSLVLQYYRSGRTAYVGMNSMQLPTSQFRIPGYSIETTDSTALPLLKAMVDQVYSTNGWGIILYHHIKPAVNGEDYTTSRLDFSNLLDYIISKGVQTLTVNQTLNLTPLSMTANFGTFTPTSGLYDLGSSLNIQAFSPAVVEGERYVWNGWTGSGSGSYTGTGNNTILVTMNGPITETASWKSEYELKISTNLGTTEPSVGDYWYEAGTSVNVGSYSPPAGTGVRYVFSGWSGTGSVPASGNVPAITFTINASSSITWIWKTQYYLSVSSDYGSVGGAGWHDAGSSVYATITPTTISGTSGTQYVFTGWSGGASGISSYSNVIVMDGPKTATANWLATPSTTPTPTSTATPVLTPSPTVSPSPSPSPSQYPSGVNASTIYVYALAVGAVIAGVIAGVIVFRRIEKRKP